MRANWKIDMINNLKHNSMKRKQLVRVNMHDAFTGATNSVCKLMSEEQIKVAESLMVNGQAKRHFDSKQQITFDWVIDEVEVLV